MFGAMSKAVVLDAEATKGAVLGENLYRTDGSVVTEADLGGSAAPPARERSLWELIANVPANVRALAALATDGWIRRDGAAITSRELAAVDSSYDNTTSGLAATDVQAAIDEVAASGGGAMTLIGAQTVTGAAATSITFTGLDLATDGTYIVEAAIKNDTATNGYVNLFYNGDTTVSNYDVQFTSGAGTSTASARKDDANCAHLYSSSTTNISIEISRDIDGKASAIFRSREGTSAALVSRWGVHMQVTAANVTSLAIATEVASALAIGSYVKIWKRN